MKYCVHCGKEINDDAVVCIYCGRAVPNPCVKAENKALGILAIIFGVLHGVVGLVLSIIGISIYKERANRNNCKIGLGLSIAYIVLLITAIIISFVFNYNIINYRFYY